MNYEILYEDEDIVAITKPRGVVVHSDARHDYPAVTDWFLKAYPESAGVGEDPIETEYGTILRPGVVHRLDRETTGVLLLAKTNEAHAHLKEQFQNRSITKVYRAVVYGQMKLNHYSVEAPIARSKQFGKWTAIPKAGRGTARDAHTEISVLGRIDKGDGYSLIEARPHTGRTHQIRVHLQYLNHPIVADEIYAGKRNTPENNLGLSHMALHAYSITFTTLDGQEKTVIAPLPQEFTEIEEMV